MTTREIFIFGSNEAGRHGKGAALHARQHHGAEYGVGVGRTGDAYAIPTKDGSSRRCPSRASTSTWPSFWSTPPTIPSSPSR